MTPPTARPAQIAFAGLAAIDAAALLALGWLAASILIHDGVMVIELSICVGLIVALAALIWGGFALERRGAMGAAIALLCVGAVPTAGAAGFWLYLEANPIDWR